MKRHSWKKMNGEPRARRLSHMPRSTCLERLGQPPEHDVRLAELLRVPHLEQRCLQPVVDVVREVPADQERADEPHRRLLDAVAQLAQVLEERHPAVFQRISLFFVLLLGIEDVVLVLDRGQCVRASPCWSSTVRLYAQGRTVPSTGRIIAASSSRASADSVAGTSGWGLLARLDRAIPAVGFCGPLERHRRVVRRLGLGLNTLGCGLGRVRSGTGLRLGCGQRRATRFFFFFGRGGGASSPRRALLMSRIAPPIFSSFSIVSVSTREPFLSLADALADLLRGVRQLVGAEKDQRDDQDHDDLAAADAEHVRQDTTRDAS